MSDNERPSEIATDEDLRVKLEKVWDDGYIAGALESSMYDEDNNPYREGGKP